ncbi:MAG: DUF4976 domain-containing protein [Proteobacteria bacterium]|nr:DUF4976 domain-containing protein [Pseudomonadota bacterium]
MVPPRFLVCFALLCLGCAQLSAAPRNILFILTDDHRYDTFSFTGHPYVETPNLDRLARGGVHCKNAFVTTSLCSPSRASILTGLYAHAHGVTDNYNPVRSDLVFFPQLLQRAGYETAFFGKWHMGETDAPQRGFDHWVAFKGQGNYWADGHGTTRVVPQSSSEGYNVNGRRVPQRGYITDELTDFTLDWLKSRQSGKPFFAYLSHKAVHSDFVAADRHKGRYAGKTFVPPKSFADTPENYLNKPMWVQNQRNSRHGVDFGYNLPNFDLQEHHRRYCETLLAVDESAGRLMGWLAEHKLLDSTLIVYMGDNGFHFGEHGLIDKRTAYEASMRVPLLLHCPELFLAGTVVTQMVANIDVAPTLLQVGGATTPTNLHGRSFLPIAQAPSLFSAVPAPGPAGSAGKLENQNSGQSAGLLWRDALFYEYYWERNYPYTPTMHAVRTDRWKYIRYHGVWDVDELYDLANDPDESRNLIHEPMHAATVKQLNARLFELLAKTQGQSMPLLRDLGEAYPTRRQGKAKPVEFPTPFLRP